MHDQTRLEPISSFDWALLGTGPGRRNAPLSPSFAEPTEGRLALSPLGGARESETGMGAVSRCASFDSPSLDFASPENFEDKAAANLGYGTAEGFSSSPA